MSLALGKDWTCWCTESLLDFFYQPFRHLELCRQEVNAKKIKTFRQSVFPAPSLCLTLSGKHRRTHWCLHPSVVLKHCQGSSFHLHWGRGEEKTERKTEGDENSDGLNWESVCYSAARGQRVRAGEEAWTSWTVIWDFPLFSLTLCLWDQESDAIELWQLQSLCPKSQNENTVPVWMLDSRVQVIQ